MLEILSGAITDISETAQHTPGKLYISKDGKIYKYVQFDNGAGNVASAANNLAYYKDSTMLVVTSDYSDANASQVAGVFLGVVTDQYYCWIQIGGVATLSCSTSNPTDGAYLKAVSTDGKVNTASLTYFSQIIAIALAAALTTTGYNVTAKLRGLI